MSDTYFPKASAELAQLLGVPGKEAEIGEFLARFGVRAVRECGRFTSGDFTNEQILAEISDTHDIGEIMEYNLTDEDEEEDE